ncbi:MAG TPA: GerMN domain-containing protein [Syntrophomonadaceae bacterium]|nr:GerMN domain-containing protein [Syntrophomonadaceae bacterium]
MRKRIITSISLLTILALMLCGIGCNKNGTDKKDSNQKQPPTENQVIDKEITLYFSDDQAMYLIAEKRIIQIEENATDEQLIKNIVEKLIKGPENQTLIPTIPPETKLLTVEIENQLAKINFSQEIQTKHWGGSTGELMTVNSLVNSITELDTIEEVLILVEGEIQESLIGHLYTKEPFTRDEKTIRK